MRHIGFSTHASCDVITEAERDRRSSTTCNVHWYWVNQANWPAIEAAKRHDMGVFIISPNDKGGKLYEPPDKLRRLCEPYSPMVFNDLFCLLRPEVHTLSLGVSKPEDFDEHMRALDLLDRAPEIVPVIEARLRAAMEETLGGDWTRSLGRGPPRLGGGSRRDQRLGNSPPLELRAVPRHDRLRQDALQPPRQRRLIGSPEKTPAPWTLPPCVP